jgi:formate hydrogenlyase subunit 6/NADH:ubiquinone oxidoreductase subunit I/coenzyme F420-reducing hydrogenase delta subunit
VTSRLPLDEIRDWLQEMKPGLRVVIADNLCQPQVMSQIIQEHQVQPAVLAGCSHLRSEMALWQEPEKCVFDPDSVGIVDLVRELEPSYQNVDLIQRAKLLLWAQVKRQEKFAGVPLKARSARFVRAQGEMSRRDLFQSLVPKYRVTPYIELTKCLGEKCRICRSGCDSKAIVAEANAISIDSANCKACGVCTVQCPRQAIIYPNFSLDQLEAEVEGLLLNNGGQLQPRVIAMVCQSSEYPAFGPNVLPVNVPCLGMVSPGLILRALDLGAQGFIVISSQERCQFKLDCSNWKGTVQFVQRLLEHWGIEPERVAAFGEENLAQELPRFNQRIAGLTPTSLTPRQSIAIPDKGLGLPAAILAMSEKLGTQATGKIASGTVPFGKIALDASKCTGCGICAAQCPTDALTDLQATDSRKLVFRQESCVGCNQCVEICPEKCLGLTRVLEVDKLNRQAEIIFEGEFAHCRICGAPFAPKAMIESVRARLGATGEAALRLETCPKCRMKGKTRLAKSGVGA